MLVKQVQAGSPELVRRIMAEIQDDIDDVLDIRQVAVSALTRDKALLIKLIRDISRPEMAFIARCGIYFGLVLGLIQTVVWAVTKDPWVLPLFGALIGWFTDWLAIKLVFFPRRAKRFGPITLHGVFQRRRDEVAKQYAEIVARDVMTVPNILDAVLRGPPSDRLLRMIHRIIEETIDEQAGIARPVIAVAVGSETFLEMKHAAADRAIRYLPDTILHAKDYATERARHPRHHRHPHAQADPHRVRGPAAPGVPAGRVEADRRRRGDRRRHRRTAGAATAALDTTPRRRPPRSRTSDSTQHTR